MASQATIIQGKNSFLDAVSASLANVGAAAGQGLIDRDKRTLAASAATADELKARLDALHSRYGGWAFSRDKAMANMPPEAAATLGPQIDENAKALDAYILARQKAMGRPMDAAEQAAIRATYLMEPTSTQQNAFWTDFNMPDYTPKPAAEKPVMAGAADISKSPAAQAAQASAKTFAPSILNKGQKWLISSTPDVLKQFGLLHVENDLSRAIPGTSSYAKKYTFLDGSGNVIASSYDVDEALKEFRTAVLKNPNNAQTVFDQFAEKYGVEPSPYGVVRPSQQGYSTAQRGVQANGTRSLAAHERATGDTHYPARVGVEEGIVNAVAMKQPGVADIVMRLNTQFPANVAESRNSYADGRPGVQPYSDDTALDEPQGFVPSGGAAFMQQAVPALGAAANETQYYADQRAQAAAMGTPPASANASATAAQSAGQAAAKASPVDTLKEKGVLAPAPPPSERAEQAWQKVKDHAAEVQAKYQINFVNPDPREKAILARELAVENRLVKSALAVDDDYKKWQLDQRKRLTSYLRNASDEEIALTFGNEVAMARDRSKNRDIQNATLALQREQMNKDERVANNFLSTLAMKSMESIAPIIQANLGKDKEGNATWSTETWNKMTSNIPWLKSQLDIIHMIQGVNIPGVAQPTYADKANMFLWVIPTGGTTRTYSFQDPYAPSAGTAQAGSSVADPDAQNYLNSIGVK
jgi:hypothetical protein